MVATGININFLVEYNLAESAAGTIKRLRI